MKFIKYTIFLDLRMKNEKIKFQRNTHVIYEKKKFQGSFFMDAAIGCT